MQLGGIRERLRQIVLDNTPLQGLALQKLVDLLTAEVFSAESLKELAPVTAGALGRSGGLKGGPACASKLGQEGRRARAQKAAHARWNKGEEKL